MPLTRPPFESGRLEFGYDVRIDALIYAMTAAGVKGAERLRDKPAGWISIFETVGAHIAKNASNISIIDAKEEFGMLHMRVIDERLGREITDIGMWCANESAVRCMAFGTPGQIRSDHNWIMTLSDAAFDLRNEMPEEQFLSLVYPNPHR